MDTSSLLPPSDATAPPPAPPTFKDRLRKTATALLLWENPALTGVVLSVWLTILICLRFMCTIRFLSAFCIAVMIGVLIYKTVRYLCVDVIGVACFPECTVICSDKDLAQLDDEHAKLVADCLVKQGNCVYKHVREIVLWKNVPQSIGSLVLLSFVFSISRAFHLVTALIIAMYSPRSSDSYKTFELDSTSRWSVKHPTQSRANSRSARNRMRDQSNQSRILHKQRSRSFHQPRGSDSDEFSSSMFQLPREVVRLRTPPPIYRRIVEKAPTPPPYIIERIVIQPAPQKIVERIIERPRTPPPRIIQRTITEPSPPPVIKTIYTKVEPWPVYYPAGGMYRQPIYQPVPYRYQYGFDKNASGMLSQYSGDVSPNSSFYGSQSSFESYNQGYQNQSSQEEQECSENIPSDDHQISQWGSSEDGEQDGQEWSCQQDDRTNYHNECHQNICRPIYQTNFRQMTFPCHPRPNPPTFFSAPIYGLYPPPNPYPTYFNPNTALPQQSSLPTPCFIRPSLQGGYYNRYPHGYPI